MFPKTPISQPPSLTQLAALVWDVIVVGAGPAGCAAAITAARAGLQVLLVDAKRFPRRKVCGGCLNRQSIALLRDLLGETHPLWAQTLSLSRFLLTHRRRQFDFPMPEGLAVDRAVLDQSLVEVAQRAGVTFCGSVTAKLQSVAGSARLVELTASGQTAQVAARAVVLASGLGGRAAGDHSALLQVSHPTSRVGIEAILETFPEHYGAGAIHMVVGRHGYVGLTQIAGRRLHVAAAVDRAALQHYGPAGLAQDILHTAGAAQLPEAAQAIWRGTPPLTCRASQLSAERVFLVGDAAGYVEPFTGEGIRWALQAGVAVAPLLVRCQTGWKTDLEREWQDWYRTTIESDQRLCLRLANGLKRAPVRWMAHQALRFRPRFASTIIERLNQES